MPDGDLADSIRADPGQCIQALSYQQPGIVRYSENLLFDVWICEDTGDGIDSWWETSKKEIRDADLKLPVSAGETGP